MCNIIIESMKRFEKPRATFLEHLTYDNHFLNERYTNLEKMATTMEAELKYLNQFIYSTYDLCGNYASNVKIVTYDGSNNVLSFICADSSGNFKPTISLDVSMNIQAQQNVADMSRCDVSRCFPYPYHRPFPRPYPPHPYHPPHPPHPPHPYHPPHPPYPYHPYHPPHPYLHRDSGIENADRGITTKPISVVHSTTVNGMKQRSLDEERCLSYPYHYPYDYPYHYPYDYPYNYLYPLYDTFNHDDDYRSILTDISFNHPVHIPPNYPPVNEPVLPPVIHRDPSITHREVELYHPRHIHSVPFHRYTHG